MSERNGERAHPSLVADLTGKNFEFLRISIILTLCFLVNILYPTFHWIVEEAREFQKKIYFCFIDYTKTLHCGNHSKLWKILNEMRIPESTIRTGHGTINCFQIGKGVHQSCILSPCLFNLYAEHSIRNAKLEEPQAGIKIAGGSFPLSVSTLLKWRPDGGSQSNHRGTLEKQVRRI